jgi:hypothetical protein
MISWFGSIAGIVSFCSIYYWLSSYFPCLATPFRIITGFCCQSNVSTSSSTTRQTSSSCCAKSNIEETVDDRNHVNEKSAVQLNSLTMLELLISQLNAQKIALEYKQKKESTFSSIENVNIHDIDKSLNQDKQTRITTTIESARIPSAPLFDDDDQKSPPISKLPVRTRRDAVQFPSPAIIKASPRIEKK